MRKETDADQIDFNKKILHMSWHPFEDSIAIAATNNVSNYCVLTTKAQLTMCSFLSSPHCRVSFIHKYRHRTLAKSSLRPLGSWPSLTSRLHFSVGSSLPGGARMIEQEHSWRNGVRMQMMDVAMRFYEQMAAEQCRLQHHDNDSEWCREITKETIINDLGRDRL